MHSTLPVAQVRTGPVPVPSSQVRWTGPFRGADEAGAVWLRVPEAGTFHIVGEAVTFEPAADCDVALRDLALAGPVANLAVRAAGMVPVHGAAVARDGLAALIIGLAATGTSTLAAGLVARGFALVGDELLALLPRRDEGPMVVGGPGPLQLPRDAAVALSGVLGAAARPLRGAPGGVQRAAAAGSTDSVGEGEPALSGHRALRGSAIARFGLSMPLAEGPLPVAAIYVLDTTASDEPAITTMTGTSRLAAMAAADWHHSLRQAQGLGSDDFVAAALATQGVPMRQVSRVDTPTIHVGRLSKLVAADFRRLVRDRGGSA